MASVLNEAMEGTRKTRIMYRCNLSHRQLQAYLRLLLGMRMLKTVPESGSGTPSLFKTSDKGHEFVDAYRKLKALMS
jgi:predicted transcriptional regulator